MVSRDARRRLQPLRRAYPPQRILYGTTTKGGANDKGTVFRLKSAGGDGPWNETVLHSFAGPTEGANSRAGLLAKPGVFYGTTSAEGPNGGGTVSSWTREGEPTRSAT